MVLLSLQCAVVGQAGSSFDVEIGDGAKVSALKREIKKEKTNDFKGIDADKLQLFLAKTEGGAWLSSVTEDVKKLKKGEKTALVESLTQEEKELQGESGLKKVLVGMLPPSTDEIHVLVVVPDGAGGSASDTSRMDRLFDRVDKVYEHTVLSKRTRYVHSEMNSAKGNILLNDLKIRISPVDTVKFAGGVPTPAKEFKWKSDRTEELQKEPYREYVVANIGDVLTNNKLCVVGVEKGVNILTVEVPGRDIVLAGRTDMIVLSDIAQKFPHYLPHLPGVRMLIEVKKVVTTASEFQALSELIALDIIVTESVMALLTNLTNHWQFFWVSRKSDDRAIKETTTLIAPGEAFAVIRTLLDQSPSAGAEVSLPCFEKPVKRQKLSQLLPSISEASGSSGIRESIERYYDIASMLGPDLEMARAVASQVARSIPTLSYFS
ncbi:Crinkler (CRN) family protein [Phytophthora infestans T30-4]|uniref:Crinkler (CRN) family protein n=1 Tax=Phytophthora infestans (strain T30-4) TaxID=403677 RepID=D0NYE7_PHYIT|nr:Crinkler (CRN) family protein [Phytophthora infestans T30-4]EEY68059.1 Crinkler (CRN) family protein [Phytophthora infestans T30-4]|eukprot:XP_002997617.1 Crinkler (CRN) family protein [Phytophthora infestans T30-4]